MSQPLSPAAQAVLDAFLRAPCDNELSVAAALRAAVYQTIRPDPLTGIDCIIYAKDILAIAAELEGPILADLSPAAQAVLDAAFTLADLRNRDVSEAEMIAAALRAAADQVVPEDSERRDTYTTEAIRLNRAGTRAKILAIAAELEARQ